VVRQRPKSFIGEVHQAIRRAGGNPSHLAGKGKGSGRFNARGRGAQVAAGLKGRNGWSRDAGGVRTKSRRVAVRARIVKLNPQRGAAIDRNVFGLSKILGNGQTTVFAAGFILSALLLRVQNLPPVPNTIRYVNVVVEAHRVASFKAIGTMIREGRSKGLSVILATQQPLDLPDIVAATAQMKICFGLPDATVATMAARKLDPHNSRLPEQIRTLGVGEAYVSLRGEAPSCSASHKPTETPPGSAFPRLPTHGDGEEPARPCRRLDELHGASVDEPQRAATERHTDFTSSVDALSCLHG
jgi:hypothetical protein